MGLFGKDKTNSKDQVRFCVFCFCFFSQFFVNENENKSEKKRQKNY